MQKSYNIIKLLLPISIIYFFSIASVYSQVNEFGLGLKLAPASVYDTIPKAEVSSRGLLPDAVDLSANMPVPGNQGKQGSCVGWASAYCVRSYYENIKNNRSFSLPADTSSWSDVFSPSFIYNQLNLQLDLGILVVDALICMKYVGAVSWKDMPYSEKDYTTMPSKDQMDLAVNHKINGYGKIGITADSIKTALSNGDPVLIGVVIDQGIVLNGRNYQSSSPYIWDHSQGYDVGGHALVIIGYDDSKNAFKVQNSWGTSWGNNGYFWISYSYLKKCVKEAYIMIVY